jgi:hypothetical protein
MTKARTAEQRLEDALREAFDSSDRSMSERQALEVACSIADQWRDRLQEVIAEEEDE